jgi:hypothetical protein
LREFFEEAEHHGEKEVDISALDIQHQGQSKNIPNLNNRIPSITNAMRSVKEYNDKVIQDTPSHNSSTYKIKYKLPRKNPIKKEKIMVLEVIPSNSNKRQKNDKSEKYFKCLLGIFNDQDYQKKCIDKCEKEYRHSDDGRILYKGVVTYSKDRFSTDFIRQVYLILKKWNMDQKAAKLSNSDRFINSIKKNAETIKPLTKYKLSGLDDYAIELLTDLFKKLILVQTNSLLVTFTKTMHFFLPNLIVPIDRKYTCTFFKIYGQGIKEKEDQLNTFISLEKAFSRFSKEYNLAKFVDTSQDWNINIPKVIDNMIIGHIKS